MVCVARTGGLVEEGVEVFQLARFTVGITLALFAGSSASAAPIEESAIAAFHAPTQSEQDRRDYLGYEAELRQQLAAEAPDREPSPEAWESSRQAARPPLGIAAPEPDATRSAAAPAAVAQRPTAARAMAASHLLASSATTASDTLPQARAATASSGAPVPAGCSLFQPGAETSTTDNCLRCHPLSQSHSVGIDYAAAAQKSPPSMYRPVEEVIRRGVFLQNGQIACVTCHDARSPWKYRIALPPGSQARPAVNPKDASSYAPQQLATAATLGAHAEVTPTPLCNACHTYGD